MARYHGTGFCAYFYGPAQVDVAFREPTHATVGQVRDLLRRVELNLRGARAAVLGLRYGYVDVQKHTAMTRSGVFLHVVVGGEDVTTRCRWFSEDEDVDDTMAASAVLSPVRICELYVLNADGRRYTDEYGLAVSEIKHDVSIVPRRCDPREPYVKLTPEEIGEWLGAAPERELPRRALDIGDGW